MLEQLRQEIETLTPQDQEQLLEFIHQLKNKPKTPDEILTESGLIGCLNENPEVSTNYKTLITEYLEQKTLAKPRKKGSAKGKLIIHQEDDDHLEMFQDYMPG